MASARGYPLDYRASDYAYIERPNAVLLALFARHVAARSAAPRVLDVGAGAGANARAVRALAPRAHLTAIEPNPQAAAQLRAACDVVHQSELSSWLAEPAQGGEFDAVLLSDVIEHVVNPVQFLSDLVRFPGLRNALFLVSVPNYAVWYNRLLTLAGRFEYAESGLYDRTHLRFFTRASVGRLLAYSGLSVIEQRVTPSLAQSLAPWLRARFQAAVNSGDHLALEGSRLYRGYARFVEPLETSVCQLWPELLGFQIVSVARLSE
ncbi:MAG TPA: methyltransferase domain-containing protein [Polyangiaceae bacterium]|nr:methyltransferase domain-containing protein [Polyangiaceae bacterium]